LDLYSSNEYQISKAINNLYDCPGNNLKLFINGNQIDLKSLNKSNEKKQKTIEKGKEHEKIKEKKKLKKEKDRFSTELLLENLT